MPAAAQRRYGLAGSDGKLYLFGGWDGAAYSADHLHLRSGHDGWQPRTPMPTPRAFLAASLARSACFTWRGATTGGGTRDVCGV